MDIKKLYPVLKSLVKVIEQFEQRFKQYKKDKLIVDFNDLEHFCLNLLYDESKNLTPVALELSSKFEEVLIDEYQDSNLVQELILLAVSRKNRGTPNRFMVGDVKQSIYKFRQSKPELFMEKYNSFSKKLEGLEIRIDLFKNFRSRKEILAGVNFLFKQLMSTEVGEVDYDDNAALYPGIEFPDSQYSVSGDIEVVLLDLKSNTESEDMLDLQSNTESEDILDLKSNIESEDMLDLQTISAIEFEAKVVASHIIKLINSEVQILDKEQRLRPVNFSDIVVLLRTISRWDSIFVTEFIKYNVPVFTDSSTGFFNSFEIMIVMSLLSIIDNPRQDIPLISVLRSPIFSFNANELVAIRSVLNKGTFFDSINAYINDNDDTNLAFKLNSFLDNLSRWRDLSVHLSIVELISTIYNDTDFLSIAGAMLGGSLRQANLRLLIDKAAVFEDSSFNGLFNFVLFIERIKNTDVGEAKLLNQNENVVKIMSIHKSKGLEFPIVFVSGLGKQFNLKDLGESILLHQNLGLGPEYVDYDKRVRYNTIAKASIARKIIQESLSEELRILYVALTRAREKLFLTGTVSNLEKKAYDWCKFVNVDSIPPFYILNSKCPLDWFMPAICRHKDANIIREIVGIKDIKISDIYNDSSAWNINIVTKENVVSEKTLDNEKESSLINNLVTWDTKKDYSDDKNFIYDKLNWKYDFIDAVSVPSSISISEIKRRFQLDLLNEYDVPIHSKMLYFNNKSSFKLPQFMEDEKEISMASVGTAFHTVLQYLDLKQVHSLESINSLLNSLLLKGLITEEQKQKINIDSILKFTNSNIAARIKLSDKVYKETPFVYGISPAEAYINCKSDEIILVHGIIDIFFEEDGQLVLIDYKTDYVNIQNLKELCEKYSTQIDIYKKALESITGMTVKESLLYLFSINHAVKR